MRDGTRTGPLFRDWKTAVLVFSVTFLLRLAYLLTLGDDPWLSYPIVDEVAYRNMALAFLDGAPDLYPFFRPPLWPMVMALWYLVAGTGSSFFGVRILSAMIGSLANVSGFRIAENLFGRRNAWFTAAITAACGVVLHLQTTGLATSLFMLLTLEAVRLSLRSYDRPVIRHTAFPAGVLWGLSALTWPSSLAGAVITAVWLAWPRVLEVKRHRRIVWEKAGWLFLGVVLAVAPVTMLNWVHSNDLAIISTNGGINFYLGNNPKADGLSPMHPVLGPDWAPAEVEMWSSEQAGRPLRPNQSSTWYYFEGLKFWRDQPKDAVQLLMKKVLVTIGGTEISNNGDWDFFADRRPMLRFLLHIGFWWIAPVGFAGLLATRRNPRTIFLAVLIAVNVLAISLFFVASRFRAPLIPLIAPFTVHAVTVLLDPGQRRKAAKVAIAAVVLIAGLNLAVLPYAQSENHAYGHLVYGMLYMKAGSTDKAAEEFKHSISISRYTPLAHLYLGDLAREREQWESAIENYRRENRIKPKYKAYRGLGICFRQIGERDSAWAAFAEGYRLNPTDDAMRQAYAEEIGEGALQAMEQGRYSAAAGMFLQAQTVAPENPFFSFGRAGAVWSQGDTVQANELIDSLFALHPEFVPAQRWVQQGWRPNPQP